MNISYILKTHTLDHYHKTWSNHAQVALLGRYHSEFEGKGFGQDLVAVYGSQPASWKLKNYEICLGNIGTRLWGAASAAITYIHW